MFSYFCPYPLSADNDETFSREKITKSHFCKSSPSFVKVRSYLQNNPLADQENKTILLYWLSQETNFRCVLIFFSRCAELTSLHPCLRCANPSPQNAFLFPEGKIWTLVSSREVDVKKRTVTILQLTVRDKNCHNMSSYIWFCLSLAIIESMYVLYLFVTFLLLTTNTVL